MKRKTHLNAAQGHGRKALGELRRMTADSALHWVLSHRTRVAQFRRAVAGTAAQKPLAELLELIRREASELKRPARPVRHARRRHRAAARSRWPAYGVI